MLIVSVASVLIYHFQAVIQAENNAYQILQDSAAEQANTFRRSLNGQCEALTVVAKSLVSTDFTNEEVFAFLDDAQEGSPFSYLFVAGSDGIAYCDDGNVYNIADRSYFQNAMKGKRSIENIKDSKINGDSVFILAVPIIKDDAVVGVVMGSYGKSDFVSSIVSQAYGSGAYSFICDKNGKVIVPSNHSSYLVGNQNFISFLKESNLLYGYSAEDVKEALSQNCAGLISFERGGKERYIAYEPLNVNDWFIFNAIPGEIIAAQVHETAKASYILTAIITILSAAFAIIIVISAKRNRAILQEENKMMQASDERFRLAMENSSISIWDYDLKEKNIVQTSKSIATHGFGTVVENVPESLIESGYVHKDSIEDFRQMYQDLFDGKPNAEGIFCVQTADRQGWWYEHIQYTNLFDSNGKAYRAVGMSQNVTDQQDLLKISVTDPLTGVYNHTATMAKIREMIINDAANQGISALFIIDLDHFKEINDTMGHQCGDKALVIAADTIKTSFRNEDILGRVGGDEFMAFVYNIFSLQIIRKKAYQLVQALQIHYNMEDTSVVLSASIGIAILEQGETFEKLYHRADKALYKVKNHGRNDYSIHYGNITEEADADFSSQPQSDISPIQLQSLMENIDGGVLLIEIGDLLRTLYISPSFYKTSGISPNKIEKDGRNLLKFIHPDDRLYFETTLRQGAKTNEPIAFSYRITSSQGKPAWRHIRAVKIHHESTINPVMIAVITDITEEKKTNALLDAVIDNTPNGIGIFAWDGTLKTVFLNPSFQHMLDYLQEKNLQLSDSDALYLVCDEDIPMVQKAIENVLSTGKAEEVIFRFATDHGNDLQYFLAKITKINDANGEDLILAILNDVTHQKNSDQSITDSYQNTALEYENKRMHFLFEKSAVEAFEVNILKRSMRCSKATQEHFSFSATDFENMPDSLIATGAIHPDSVDAYRQFYDSIYAGKPSGSCIIRVKLFNGTYTVQHLVFETIFDSYGKPLRAIGFSETLRKMNKLKFIFDQEDKMYEIMQGNFLSALRVNVTQNKIERAFPQAISSRIPQGTFYEEYLQAMSYKFTEKHDFKTTFETLKTTALKEQFEKGKDWLFLEFPFSDSKGNIEWVHYHARLHISPYNGDLYLFSYIRKNDTAKKAELMLTKKPVKNKVTGVYDAVTTKELVDNAIAKHENDNNFCGMIVLRINNYANIAQYVTDKHLCSLQNAVSRKLSMFLGESEILGQLTENRFVAFAPDIHSQEEFREFGNQLMTILNSPNFITIEQEQNLEYTMGIVCAPHNTANFDNLFAAALKAKVNASPLTPIQMGHVAPVAGDSPAQICFTPANTIIDDTVFTKSIQESQIFRKCTQFIATSTVPCSQIDNVLNLIGNYFDAERAYILEMPEDGFLKNTYEWCAEGITAEKDNL